MAIITKKALGFANRSNQLLNQMDKSQFQNNTTKMIIFKESQADFITFEEHIEGKENYNDFMVLLHMGIHPNFTKLFDLKSYL